MKEFKEWQELINRDSLEPGEYRELIRLNHLVMEKCHEIHNDNMLEGRKEISAPPLQEEQAFRNSYDHCGHGWSDIWSCACNDECPICGKEIEPYASEKL